MIITLTSPLIPSGNAIFIWSITGFGAMLISVVSVKISEMSVADVSDLIKPILPVPVPSKLVKTSLKTSPSNA